MENASKALIIAGAILLAILIISLGIIVYRQAAGVIDSNSMDEVAVTTFNSKFTQYEGDNVRGANVNALINTIIQNNLSNSDDTSKQVKLAGTGLSSTSTPPTWSGTAPTSTGAVIKSIEQSGSALTGRSYEVSATPDPQSGYITTVTIKPAS